MQFNRERARQSDDTTVRFRSDSASPRALMRLWSGYPATLRERRVRISGKHKSSPTACPEPLARERRYRQVEPNARVRAVFLCAGTSAGSAKWKISTLRLGQCLVCELSDAEHRECGREDGWEQSHEARLLFKD